MCPVKPITGQYECVHSSGVGLDYFTSRIDRITLQSNGRFVLTIQNQSRAVNAAQSLMKGQQASTAAPETRREGTYTYQVQGLTLTLQFDDGGIEQARVAPDGEGLSIGPNFFTRVSDSTFLPPTHRLQKDMDDIAKGLKIAGTIGGMALKAAKTIQGTIQVAQGSQSQPGSNSGASTPTPAPLYQPASPQSSGGYSPQQPPSAQHTVPGTPGSAQSIPAEPPPQGVAGALFCDQCGARVRSGKRFCNNCGAPLA
ncbi:MAG: hypothetical protein PVSMB5_14980 [Ktedonobacteraceae bacterium]